MAQFRLRHPTDPQGSAHYGWDGVIGWFVELRRSGRVVGCYDALKPGYDAERPLEGALQTLVDAGFFSHDDIGEAVMRGEEELPEDMPEPIRRVAYVIRNFRVAAD